MEDTLRQIAARHHVSEATVFALAEGLRRTGGRQVQFNHAELGGMGQWMPGMVMVGNMFDSALKARVDALVTEIATAIAVSPATATSAFPAMQSDHWWPEALGVPNSAGSQNGIRYAYFAAANRLIVEQNGRTIQYDTTGYRIQGVAQQQSGSTFATLTFSSDRGPVPVNALPVVA